MGLVFKSFSASHAKQPGAVNAPNLPFLLVGGKTFCSTFCFFCFVFLTYGPSFCSPPVGSVQLWGWDVVLGKRKWGKGEGDAPGSYRH